MLGTLFQYLSLLVNFHSKYIHLFFFFKAKRHMLPRIKTTGRKVLSNENFKNKLSKERRAGRMVNAVM